MNFRQTYILFGVVAASLLLLGLAQVLRIRPAAGGDYLFPSFQEKSNPPKPEDITAVQIKLLRPDDQKRAITLARADKSGGWELHEPLQYPVHAESTAVDELIRQVTRARREALSDVENKPSLYGLDNPRFVVTLSQGQDREWKLYIGDESPDKRVLYANSSEVPRPVAVRRADLDGVFKSATEFRSKELLNVTAFNTTAFEATVRDPKDPGKPATVAVEKKDGNWRVTKPFDGEADFDGDPNAGKDQLGVKGMLTDVGSTRVTADADFVKDGVTDFTEYGLTDGQEYLRFTGTYTRETRLGSDKATPVTETLLVGKKTDDKPDTKTRYARLLGLGGHSVVKIDASKFDPVARLVERPEWLRSKDLAKIDTHTVDAIDVLHHKTLLKLRKDHILELWKIHGAADKPLAVDTGAVLQLLNAVKAPRQVREHIPAAKAADYDLAKPEGESTQLTVWADGFDHTGETGKAEERLKEPKLKTPDKPVLKLVFGKEDRDKGQVAVHRLAGGDNEILEIPAALAGLVSKSRLYYLEKVLPASFTSSEPVKLVLTRPDGTYEMEAQKKDDKSPVTWVFRQPKDLAGRTADVSNMDNILRELRELHPQAWVAEKPPERELEDLGLTAPRYKAVVSVKREKEKADKKGEKEIVTEELTYTFGNKSKDGSGLNALLKAPGVDSMLVFTVRPEVLTTLDAELRDRVLFNFAEAKVKRLTFLGWKNKFDGEQVELALERADGKPWKITKSPFAKAFELDPGKVDEFLSQISTTRVELFLKGGAKPEYDLDPGRAHLLVTLDIDGEKAPLTLAVGKADGDKGYYGKASTGADQAVLLPSSPFKTVIDGGPKHFKK